MSPALYDFVAIDLPAMITGTLAVVVCGLLGNFLILRRLSLLGDAISHSVLPGLVAGFVIAGTRNTIPMFLGAAVAGLLTVGLVELIRKLARLESGAAMGVVFSIFFALGVLMIEQTAARAVDLDPDCVLNGQLELVNWFPPANFSAWTLATFFGEHGLPRQLWTLAAVTAIAAALVALFFKELRLVSFDPALATALGINSRLVNAGFMIMVAAAVVASFEAVGSILVIAMLVVPGACARLLTDRLSTQLWLSVWISLAIGIAGYTLAALAPLWLGFPFALNAAGMMAVLGGAALALTIALAPRHGLLARRLSQRRLASAVAREDLLAALYRAEENALPPPPAPPGVLSALRTRGEVQSSPEGFRLTQTGREAAREIIQSHRLWETFLVDQAGIPPDHVHPTAEKLEHIRDSDVKNQLQAQSSRTDPHGKPIPRG